MHHFDRRRDPQRRGGIDVEKIGAGGDQEGADALAAAKGCIAHGLDDAGLGSVAGL